MDQWIAASVSMGDGRVLRYGPDEEAPENQPTSFEFSTSNPGGFGTASITLPRPFGPSEWENDRNLFAAVEVYGPLGTIYEGFISGTPQSGRNEVTLSLTGWVSALDRHETFRQVFVDRDLSRWGPASVARQITLRSAGFTGLEAASTGTDTTTAIPALTATLPAAAVNPLSETWYDAGAATEIASIYYDMISDSTSSDTALIGVAADDIGGSADSSADFLTGTDSSASGTFTPTTPLRFGRINMNLAGTVGATDRYTTWRHLAVFGNHGLTKRGTAPNQGYYASDVISYAVNQCSSLTSTLGESIEETSFVIPHLTFTEDTSLRSVIEQITSLGGNQNVANDWGVYENREFYWRSPGTYGRTWHVRRDQVAEDSSDGPDADRRVAGVKINYQDAAGTSLSVGPPGSNADYETTDLLDNDPDNPAFRIPGAFKSETIGISPIETGFTYSRLAVNVGVMILNERNRQDWRGSVTVTGEAEDENGNSFPASLIRSGDQIVISDSTDTTPRTIVSTQYDHSSLTCSAAIGAAPDSLEALLGQLAAVTDLVSG